jgi:hypothetical protein
MVPKLRCSPLAIEAAIPKAMRVIGTSSWYRLASAASAEKMASVPVP